MIRVTVDGSPFQADLSSARTIGEVVELLKASIDPDTIITAMTLDGGDLSENDWRTPLALHANRTFEVETGLRSDYVNERLGVAAAYLERIADGFIETTKLLKSGDVKNGNTSLGRSVSDLKAFVSWYSTILQLLSDKTQAQKFEVQIRSLLEVCEQMLQQQLYRAWWAVAETIEKKLKPELDLLKGQCLMVLETQQ